MARILVIDDDPQMRELLGEALRTAGHEVVVAVDGKDGVNKYRLGPTDLVITDLYMPNQDGLETIQAFQKEFYGVAIIAMCGKIGNAVPMLKVARQLGAVEVLQKPFFSHELLAVVERVLKSEMRAG
jgi:DNA-binding NtrC family response regulator